MIKSYPANQPLKKVAFDGKTIMYSVSHLNELMATDSQSIAGSASLLDYYGVFSKMKLTNRSKFVTRTIRVAGIQLVSPVGSCGWNPIKGVAMESREHMPCEVEHQSQLCVDDLAHGCLGDFIRFTENGKYGVAGNNSEEMNRLLGMIADMEIKAINSDARAKLSYGSIFMGVDASKFSMKKGLAPYEKDQYERGANACVGYPRLAAKMAADQGYSHMNLSHLLDGENCNGKKYEGSVVDLIQGLLDNAPSELATVVSTNGVMDDDGQWLFPVAVVSLPIYNALVAEYRAYANDIVTKMNAITVDSISSSVTMNGVSRTVSAMDYRIHNLPIVCDPYINELDKYTNATTFFACITVAGNINFGKNFGSTNGANHEEQAGIVIQNSGLLRDGGAVDKQANVLLATAIASPKHFVGALNIEVEPVVIA